jgi:hypothetical protein
LPGNDRQGGYGEMLQKQIDSKPEKIKAFELIHMRDEFKALIQALKNKKRE